MAAVTLLGTATWTTASGTKTVTATPALGDVIVLVVGHTGNTSAAAPTDNNSDGGGTYTLVNTALKTASADTLKAWVRNAPIGVAASTVFTHAPGTTTGGGVAVMKVTGMLRCGADAIRQSAVQNNQATATPTVALGAAALTANALIGASFNSTGAMTPRSSPAWTERVDLGYANPTTQLHVMSIDSGETGTSIAWGSSTTTSGSIVLELDTSVPPILSAPDPTEDAPTEKVEESEYEAAPIAALIAIAASGAMMLCASYTEAAAPVEEPYAHVYVTTPYVDNDLAAAGTLSITGSATLEGPAAALAPQSSLPTHLGPFLAPRRETGSQSVLVSSDVAANGTLSITGTAATLTGLGTLAAPGTLSITGTAANLKAAGSLAAPGTVAITGAANVTALGTLAAPGTLSINGFANLTELGTSALQAVGSLAIAGVADLRATGTIAAPGTLSITGFASLLDGGAAPALIPYAVTEEWPEPERSEAYAQVVVYAVQPPAASDVQAAGSLSITGVANLTAAGTTLQAVGTLSITGAADLDAIGRLRAARAEKRINFRATFNYVTDVPPETYALHTDLYPTVRDGQTFGWESSSQQGRNRNLALDRRIAGLNFATNEAAGAIGVQTFRLDLDSAGPKLLYMAVGDGTSSSIQWVEVQDGTTTFIDIPGTSVAAAEFLDATLAVRTAAAWPADQQPFARTFTSTICRVRLNSDLVGLDASSIAHLSIVDDVPGATLSISGEARLGDGRLLTSSLSSHAPIRVGPFRPPRRGTGSTYVEPAIDLGAAGAFWITGDATLEGVVVTLTANGTLSITGDASLSALTKLVSVLPQRLGPFLPPQRSTGGIIIVAPTTALQAGGTLAITGVADLTAAATTALIPYAVTEELPEVAPTDTYIQVVVLAPPPEPGTIAANGTLAITGSAALTSNVVLVGREAKRLGPFFLLFRRGTASQRIDRDSIAAAGSLAIIGSGAILDSGAVVVDLDFGDEDALQEQEPSFTAFVAPVSAVGTITANGSIAITGNATVRAPGTLSAAGTLSISGFANLTEAGTSALQAVGTLSITGNAELDASGTLAAPGTLSITGAANLKGLGVLAAPGTASITGAANLKALGTLGATGSLAISGAANLGAAGVLVGTLTITGNASLSATAQLAANTGSLSITGVAPLGGSGKLLGAGTLAITGTNALLKAAGEARADGSLAITGLATPSARGALAATTGTVWITGDASIIALGSSQLQADSGSLSITGDAFATSGLKNVAANGSLAISGTADLKAYGRLLGAGSLAISGTASDLEGVGELRAQGSVLISGAAQMRGIGRLLASGTLVIDGFGGLAAGEVRYRAVVTARQRNRDARMGRQSRLSRATERVRVLRAPPVIKN